MSVPFSAISSVEDRTIFTYMGPIVKQPYVLLSGSNLTIISANQIIIPNASFNSSYIGKTVTITTGIPSKRNDGVFTISSIVNTTTLMLANANFDFSDSNATLALVITLVNNIKSKFNSHVVNWGTSVPYVHGVIDSGDIVSTPDATDLPTTLTLANQLQTSLKNHISLPLPTHLLADSDDLILLPRATSLSSAYYLVNALRQSYELHRDSAVYHYARDSVDRVTIQPAQVIIRSGPNVGPFNWIISDPRIGEIADSTDDVIVKINNSPVGVDAVFGLLGAVVLTDKPSTGTNIDITYNFLSNPSTQIKRLNSFEFNLNQDGNSAWTGLPGNTYKARATLIDPSDAHPIIRSPYQPKQIGWKYKMFERGYTACLNDPNTLLLNVPTNKIFYPVLNDQVSEVVIRYDPTTLPDQATDPWTLEGQGIISISPGGSKLIVIDNNQSAGPDSLPPFYTHPIDLTFSSNVSAAFRVSIPTTTINGVITPGTVPDGVFTGVAFGVSDGEKVSIAGLLLTNADNLSSAIVMLNNLSSSFDAHLTQFAVHKPNDTFDSVNAANAFDLQSLIILANRLKTLFNNHVLYGPSYIHLLVDGTDIITSPNATDLQSSLVLINQIFTNFNTHLIATGVHYNNDTVNTVSLVQQIGILTNSGYQEFGSSWNSGSTNWSEDTTYRIFRDSNGDVSLYVSGSAIPIASVTNAQLPASSDINMKLDPMAQVFFGSIGYISTSTSQWSFIRVDVAPLDEDQIGVNKSVNYIPTVLPELDPNAPWITIGQSGYERISGGSLVLDSTANAPPENIQELGMTTGAYRGFLRLEPILTQVASSTIEFTANVVFYTFSLDNRAAGVYIDDDTFSTWFVFLQDTPSAAVISGTVYEPSIIITSTDYAVIIIDSGEPITIAFPTTTSANIIANTINSAVGFPLANGSSGNIVLTDHILGATSTLQLLGGSALLKLGLSTGVYHGKDSNPEPKISWFGENFPNKDVPQWTVSGSQSAQMLGRTLRITDSNTTDFLVYTISNVLYTGSVFNPLTDWKVDFRLAVQSFTAGGQVLSGNNLYFAGVLVNIDEGIGGKNIEVQYSTDQYSNTYINILSYNQITGNLDQQIYFPFNWNDGKVHSIDLFTNKGSGICILLADNQHLGLFSYTSLNAGVSGPSITFGSGGSDVTNANLSSAKSVVDWKSVCGFRDSKISDPTSASRRYVGIYRGGDPSLLASYFTYPIDWYTNIYTYRIVRDPSNNVSVFIPSVSTSMPVISFNYNDLNLPDVKQSFLQPITGNRECIAFGSFESEEITRIVWGSIKYSIGKLTITDGLIPSHQVLNQSNTVSSPEHLMTTAPHQHYGFTSYSGGTPTDDFMNDQNVSAYTNLGEGTPPIPKTQNLESRGGLVRTATLQESVTALQFVNENGFLTDLEDDTTNSTPLITITDLQSCLIVLNNILSAFNNHMTQYRVHLSNDYKNAVCSQPAIDIDTGMVLANTLEKNYNTHRTAVVNDSNAPVHVLNDTINVVNAPVAIDLPSLMTLTTALNSAYNEHLTQSGVHGNSIFIKLNPPINYTQLTPYKVENLNESVIYESMEFFKIESGECGHVAPFSDENVLGTMTDSFGNITYIKL